MALGTAVGLAGTGVANQAAFARWALPMRSGVKGMTVTPSTALKTIVAGAATGHAAYVPGVMVPNTSNTELTHSANGSSNARVDLIALRINFATSAVSLLVIEGTPATNPVAPTPSRDLAGVWEEPIAEVTVTNANGVFSGSAIVDVRADPGSSVFAVQTARGYLAALERMPAGSIYTLGSSVILDNGTAAGTIVTEAEADFTPSVAGITGSLVKTCKWSRQGPYVKVRCNIAAPASGSSALTSGATVSVTMPVSHGATAIRAVGTGMYNEGTGIANKPITVYVEPGSATARILTPIKLTGDYLRLYNPSDAGLGWSVGNGSSLAFNIEIVP